MYKRCIVEEIYIIVTIASLPPGTYMLTRIALKIHTEREKNTEIGMSFVLQRVFSRKYVLPYLWKWEQTEFNKFWEMRNRGKLKVKFILP